ncbi:MAG: TetR/AcrR family transcriptional regulator [Pseudomonadota bacterium]
MPASKPSRREALTDLAIAMMQKSGFSALGLRDLAEAAQMRPPSLYNYFASKDDMARAALAHYVARHRAELEALDAVPTGAGRIRLYSRRCGECVRRDGSLCLFLMLTADSHDLSADAVGEMRGLVEEQMDWLARAWDAGLADGSIQSAQAGAAMGPVLFGALRGMMVFSILQPDPEADFTARMESLLAGLGVA